MSKRGWRADRCGVIYDGRRVVGLVGHPDEKLTAEDRETLALWLAAPELLAAVRLMLPLMRHVPFSECPDLGPARAALDKARGE